MTGARQQPFFNKGPLPPPRLTDILIFLLDLFFFEVFKINFLLFVSIRNQIQTTLLKKKKKKKKKQMLGLVDGKEAGDFIVLLKWWENQAS